MRLHKKIQPEFEDARGGITKILDDGKTNIKSILLITSKKGAVRANHYHKRDSHYCYMVYGKMEYSERPVGSKEKPTMHVVNKGEMAFSKPMVEHAMRFLEDTVWVALFRNCRHQEDYESDTVRVKMIG